MRGRHATIPRAERVKLRGSARPGRLPFRLHRANVSSDVDDLIAPDEIAFRLELTAAQLKIVHTALKSLFDDLGHEEHDVKQVVSAVLDKLPGEHEIRAIDIERELRRSPAA